jgi:hypothetical protein
MQRGFVHQKYTAHSFLIHFIIQEYTYHILPHPTHVFGIFVYHFVLVERFSLTYYVDVTAFSFTVNISQTLKSS